MKKIQYLEWDTNFFGFKIGKLITNRNINLNALQNTSYKLIYIYSNTNLNNIMPIDTKVIFKKNINQLNIYNLESIEEFDVMKHSYTELLDLVYLSGIHSRFKIDNKFSDIDFKRLYQKWIDESINKNIAFSVLIKTIKKEIAGFITLEIANEKTSKIGLIAVSPKFQGKGIATQLIKKAETVSKEEGFIELQVATQLINKPAINLYKKNGFKMHSVTNIYHLWNK